MGIRGWNFCCLGVLLFADISQGKEPKPNKNVEVTVEVKFVEVDRSVVDELKRHGGLLGQESKPNDVPLLDKDQMVRCIQAVQNDVRSSVIQTPRITVRNRQRGDINILDEKKSFVTGLTVFASDGQIVRETKTEVVPLGLQMHVHPFVSMDRRSVRMHFGLDWKNLVSTAVHEIPITMPAPREEKDTEDKVQTVKYSIEEPQFNKINLSRTLTIPDGKTAVLTGSTRFRCEGRNEYGVPILCNLPYVGRLFRNVGYYRWEHHLLVLVTPCICVPHEEEERMPPSQDESR